MCLTVVGFIARRALVGYSSPYLAHFRFVASALIAAASIQFLAAQILEGKLY
jgi:hypothetical protein